MAKPFDELRERLLRAGIAPRHVRRYLSELNDHSADLIAEEDRTGQGRSELESAAMARLGETDILFEAMVNRRQFHSLSGRAPWAIFGLAPLFLLAAAYFIAGFILWSGWKIFLPGKGMPFVKVDGWAILYFGVGKWLYFGAPLLVGWGLGITAARQRIKIVWPVVGMALLALIGSNSRVNTSPPTAPGGAGHVTMQLSITSLSDGVSHALAILSLALLPYLTWRLLRSRALAVSHETSFH